MKRNTLLAIGMYDGRGGSVALPYTFDPSTYADGALPSPWEHNTFAISSGKIVNTPALENELLSDTGLESTYVGGLCGSLLKTGTPTLVDETSDVHGGSHAQRFTAVAVANSVYKSFVPTANRWVIGKTWAKRIAGTGGTVQLRMYQNGGLNSGAGPTYATPLIDAAYTQKEISFFTKGTGTLFFYPAYENNTSGFDTLIVDDVSAKYMALADGFATVETGQPNVSIKIRLTHPSRAMVQGCVARLDSKTNPQNYVLAWIQRYPTNSDWIYGSVAEVVNGVMTILLNQTYFGAIPDATLATKDIELRINGASCSLWYDGAQKGATVTTSVLTGTRHGLFNVGGAGNSCNRFFCASNLIQMLVGFAGSSLTANGTTGYRIKTMSGMEAAWQNYDFIFQSNALSGHGTFSSLVRLSELSNNELVITDIAGLDNAAELEALIRRCWGANQRLIVVVTPTWADYLDDGSLTHPLNEVIITAAMDLMDFYGVPYVDFWAMMQAHVASGGHISDWYADYIHMSETGYTAIASYLLANYLPLGGTVGSLPARQDADTADFEHVPTRKVGTAYDGRTGTWMDNGTQVTSNVEGSTITFSGTFRWYGCYRSDGGTNTVEISLDGGAFASTPFRQYPQDTGTLTTHTIVVRIPSGGNCVIDEFWAI